MMCLIETYMIVCVIVINGLINCIRLHCRGITILVLNVLNNIIKYNDADRVLSYSLLLSFFSFTRLMPFI